ncbi:hypothetical protein MLD38_021588 [Melastoma candidum]|uniref:Uncharacterized protein n=1 Tax=Melastoma candidum TaxID=119954 RepID=A0ACB9QID3_9MYRT|nr:hypothetical protein MLD38_021588 [Melastoma candidum]
MANASGGEASCCQVVGLSFLADPVENYRCSEETAVVCAIHIREKRQKVVQHQMQELKWTQLEKEWLMQLAH